MQSKSWLVAVSEMAMLEETKLKKIYKPFCSNRERLMNMVKGERLTINMSTVLYPGQDTVVRVGRHNARVDEGYNEVVALNASDIEEQYKGWVVVMDSVANGEAFIIVRNNAEQAISLPAGALTIAIRPAVCLPRILTKSDLERLEEPTSDEVGKTTTKLSPQQVLATRTEHVTLDQELNAAKNPISFFSWNCNGLNTRVQKKDLEEKFYSQLDKLDPDIISLQEVRMQCEPEHPDTVLKNSRDSEQWATFMAPLQGKYDAYLSLSSLKYGGQAVLVKKSLTTPTVFYNMGGNAGHYGSG